MRPIVVVHGGAGDLPVERRSSAIAGCGNAAREALAVLTAGGSALDAVEVAVRALEDDPSFNAGTGGCLTAIGTLELDASITDGRTLRTGAVCAMPPFPNPVSIARAVLRDGRHALLAAGGAADFAVRAGFAPANAADMITEGARRALRAHIAGLSDVGRGGGTVGAVAMDHGGHVAAATSTGGMVGKLEGRVGDSPIVGAGNDADDSAGGASATGHGEAIMRACLARAAIERMRASIPAPEAARESIALLCSRYRGYGGIILVDRTGTPGLAFNTKGMSHAIAVDGEEVRSGC
jgi:beta-aspartyl-peptidase (threonine type)